LADRSLHLTKRREKIPVGRNLYGNVAGRNGQAMSSGGPLLPVILPFSRNTLHI